MTSENRDRITRLSPERRAELERRLLERRTHSTRRDRILPREDRGPSPLSSAQKRLWFLDQLEASSAHYIIARAFRLFGPLDRGVLKTALDRVIERHESLRTVFVASEGEPFQRVEDAAGVDIMLLDLGEQEPVRREAELSERIIAEAGSPMDLETGPLLRVSLYRLDALEHVLLVCVHHIIFDGWSMGIFFREWAAVYDAHLSGDDISLPELPIQYADYAIWQQNRLKSEVSHAQRAYWKDHLRGAPALLELPTDRPRPRSQSFRGAQQSWAFDRELVHALRDISRRENVTMFMTLLAVLVVLLHRYSGQDDIVIGSPSAGRSRLEIEELVGFFVNTLVLRTKVTPDSTFRQLLHQVRRITLEAYENQDVPFEQIVEDVMPERHLSASPIFQVMFALQNVPKESFELSRLEVEPLLVDTGASKFDISLFVFEEAERLELRAEYNPDLFDVETIQRLLRGFETLLEGIVTDREQLVSRIPLLTPVERKSLLIDWSGTEKNYGRDTSIQTLFEAQVERSPHAIAVVDGGRSLSYRELNQRANRIAHRIQRMGVKAGTLAGIHLERSAELIVGLLGILKAGGVYVPLDPNYPEERLSFIVNDAKLPLVLTEKGRAASFPGHGAEIIVIDSDTADTLDNGTNNPVKCETSEHPAYVIYTSGSTGAPKGVLGLHRATLNRLRWMWETFPFEPHEVCCLKTPLNFVDSVGELFGPLLQGMPIVVLPDADVMDPYRLVRTLAEHEVTRIVLVPSLLKLLLDTHDALGMELPRLSMWTCSGETLTPELVNRFRRAVPNARLLNLYGSAEVSADATYFDTTELEESTSIPIGRPIANMRAYVLDGNLEPMPVGAPGELYVAGVGVSGGYLHRPELTRECFIANPFDSERFPTLFKSGDRARFRADGNLDYLGRSDHQINIRGYRIEPGEIEHALRQHASTHEAVVVSREDDEGDLSLVAYVVSELERTCDVKELRSFLRKRLPAFMLPSTFVALDALPLAPSGKIDRLALPAPELRQSVAREPVKASNELEARMARLWEDLLGVQSIGVHDDFFELGGHSFLAIRLVMRVQKEFGREFAVLDVFRTPTVHELVRLLGDVEAPTAASASCVVPIQPRGSRPPFFFTGLGGGHLPRNLSKHLGRERPFYALLSLEDMDRGSVGRLAIREMAERYVSELQDVQREGPYFLGAFCGQGIVAYEMARQLESQGQEVAFLGIFEAPAPGRRTIAERMRHIIHRDTLRAKSHRRNLKRLPARARIQYVLEMARSFSSRIRRRLTRAGERVKFEWYVSTGRPVPDALRRAWSVRATIRREYAAKPLKARITLFLGRESHHMQDNVHGWDALSAGGVEVHMISGEHTKMLLEPHVAELGNCLEACLRAAEFGTSKQDTEFERRGYGWSLTRSS